MRDHDPYIIFLFETMVEKDKINKIDDLRLCGLSLCTSGGAGVEMVV